MSGPQNPTPEAAQSPEIPLANPEVTDDTAETSQTELRTVQTLQLVMDGEVFDLGPLSNTPKSLSNDPKTQAAAANLLDTEIERRREELVGNRNVMSIFTAMGTAAALAWVDLDTNSVNQLQHFSQDLRSHLSLVPSVPSEWMAHVTLATSTILYNIALFQNKIWPIRKSSKQLESVQRRRDALLADQTDND